MSAKSDALDYQKKKDKAQSEAARSESRRGQFEGTTWVPATKLKERSDASALDRKSNLANRNALAMQKAKDAGSLAVADRRQTGQTTRTGMTESGLGTRQTATLGQGQSQFNRTQGLEEFKSFSSTDPVTGENVRDPGAARDFNAYMGKGISIPQERLDAIAGGSRPQDGNVSTITRADGTKERYDASGNIIQPEQAPPSVAAVQAPTSLPPGQTRVPTRLPGDGESLSDINKKPFGYDFLNTRFAQGTGLKGASMIGGAINRNVMDMGRSVGSIYDWLKQPVGGRK